MFDPMLVQFPKIPQFYHYRNQWGCETLEETSIKCAEALEAEILKQGPENIMAFISEPVVGSAAPGVHPAPIYFKTVSYTHLRAHETRHDLVCRLLLEKKKNT